MENVELKSLLTEALQKIESLMDKCESLPSIRNHGTENIQQEMKMLKDWLKARKDVYYSIEEASGKLASVRWNSQPGTFYSHLYDASTDIGHSLTSLE